ncbi:MAG TPA: crosslink repair DNA glycosylase YcaQ family protein [Bellilinea sp.]|nr:crosslink repair DNA glycosylase YcaQ family protein [Bellilinea sp.]
MTPTKIEKYQNKTFRLDKPLNTKEDAVKFVNQRGFVFFWPLTGTRFPSLWAAKAGDRPVPNNHDDPGHATWGWKDSLLDKRVWHYGKILSTRNTIISLELLPYFYALSPNYGEPEQDYQLQYEQGTFTQEAKSIYEAILEHGALDRIALQKEAKLASSENKARFERALNLLQAEFKLMPIRIAEVGAYNYAYVYEAVHRYYPKLIAEAGVISEADARNRILRSYFLSLGASTEKLIKKFFKWTPQQTEKSINRLESQGFLKRGVTLPGSSELQIVLSELAK